MRSHSLVSQLFLRLAGLAAGIFFFCFPGVWGKSIGIRDGGDLGLAIFLASIFLMVAYMVVYFLWVMFGEPIKEYINGRKIVRLDQPIE